MCLSRSESRSESGVGWSASSWWRNWIKAQRVVKHSWVLCDGEKSDGVWA